MAPPSTSVEDVVRDTGNMERFNLIRNSLHMYSNIHLSALYTLPSFLVSTYSLESIIYSAIALNLKTQPLLGVTVEDAGTKKPRWRRLEMLELRGCVGVEDVSWSGDGDGKGGNEERDSWVGEGHWGWDGNVDGELPLWRMRVGVHKPKLNGDEEKTKFTVAFYAHHGIADGMSLGAFHLQFLTSLNHLITNPHLISSNPVITVPKIPLTPTLEEATPLPVSPLYVLKQITKAFIYDPQSPLSWTGPPIPSTPPTTPPIAYVSSFTIPAHLLSTILAACHEQRTTLTCLITVLVARKLALLHRDEGFRRFTASVPFSLRKFTSHSNRDMGCFVSMLTLDLSSEDVTPGGMISCCSPEKGTVDGDADLWQAARECKKHIDSGTKSIRNQITNMLGWVSDYKSFFLGRLGGKRSHAFEITNVGVFDGGLREGKEDGEDRATFENMLFSTNLCTYADPHCVTVVSVRGGGMTVGVNWVREVTGDEEAVGLRGYLEGGLRGVGEGYVVGRGLVGSVEEKMNVGRGVGIGDMVLGCAGLVGVLGVAWMLM